MRKNLVTAKRMAAITVVAIMMMSMAACGKKKSTAAEQPETTATETKAATIIVKDDQGVEKELNVGEIVKGTDAEGNEVEYEVTEFGVNLVGGTEGIVFETVGGQKEAPAVEVTEVQTDEPTEAPPVYVQETAAPTEAPASQEPQTQAPVIIPPEVTTAAPIINGNMPVAFYTPCSYNGLNGFFFPRAMGDVDMVKYSQTASQCASMYGPSNTMEIFVFDDMGKVAFQSFWH